MVDMTEKFWCQLTEWVSSPVELLSHEKQLIDEGDKINEYYTWKYENGKFAIFTIGERILRWGKV